MKSVADIHKKNFLNDSLLNSLKPVSVMVDSFVKSLSTANDSGSFDTSLEVKPLNPNPSRTRTKCVTELDREEILKFVREFEQRRKNKLNLSKIEDNNNNSKVNFEDSFIQSLKETPLKEELSENEENIELGVSSTPIKTEEEKEESSIELRKHTLSQNEVSSADSDFESTDQEFFEEVNGSDEAENDLNKTVIEAKTPENHKTPQMDIFRRTFSFKKPHICSDGKQCKAAKMLQFFSSARKKCKNTIKPASCSTSRSESPVSTRSSSFSQPRSKCTLFPRTYYTDDDDGFSTNTESRLTSRNPSPDSSDELQPPIVPSFKVTPPSTEKTAAYELAKILRESFHVKRASVHTLRRSLSDPDSCRLDFDEVLTKLNTKDVDHGSEAELISPKSGVKKSLGAAIIKNLDLICGPSRDFARRNYNKVSRALPSAESPFRRWGQSSFRSSRSNEQRTPLSRRPSSLAASENDVYTKSIDDFGNVELEPQRSHSEDINGLLSNHHQNTNEINGGVTAWGSSFEKLLDDPAGLHTFAEFLKKEFSAENIYFWTACERYRQIIDNAERATKAMEIFSKHLATGAPEPVNVDSQARNIAEENLQTADKTLFSQAQKQIFNLMKFDSYQRFIRSDLYKKCLEAESKNQPLPYPGEQLDEMLRTNLSSPGPSKLKKSLSNAEDRRRKSLLPWHRKVRCKSRDRGETDVRGNTKTVGKNQSAGYPLKGASNNSTSDIHSSRSSLSSFDAAAAAMGNGSDDVKPCSLCRVILCDGATTVVQTRQNETVRQLVERLLEKRGIHYQCFDVLITGNTKAVDLDLPATMLAGKEVHIEQRVAFKLDLPDPKVISVRSKPKKALGDVLKPILHKYNYRAEDVQVLFRDTHDTLEMNMPVTVADGQRLQVVLLKPEAGWQQDNGRGQVQPNFKNPSCQQPPVEFGTKINGKTANQQSTLDEITNKVFNELLQGKVDSHANQGIVPKASDQGSLRSEECESESSSIFGRLRRRDSNNLPIRSRPKKILLQTKAPLATPDENFNQTTNAADQTNAGTKKPLIAKWKTGVKLQVTGRPENHEEFLEGLNRAQRARLEDQRGTEINSELPDFLKDKENLNSANKTRKSRLNSNGIILPQSPPPVNAEPVASIRTNFESQTSISEKPQPAPRLSIAKSNGASNMSCSNKMDTSMAECSPNSSNASNECEYDFGNSKGPPPLPPKPKILPIKPSNWGQTASQTTTPTSPITSAPLPSKIPIDITRRHINAEQNARNIYLDQPSSSFV